MIESTRRALRTGLQGLATTLGFVLAFAIPGVEDALNGLIHVVEPDVSLPPGLVLAVGTFATAVLALVAKIQNWVEGRDEPKTVEQVLAEAGELIGLANEARAAGKDVVTVARK